MAETMNNTVEETTLQDSVQDDAVQDQATPNALEEFMADTVETESREQTEETEQPKAEQAQEQPLPKGLRGRIQAAEQKADKGGYERGRREAEQAYQNKIAEYEQRLAKYAEMEVTLEAQELARKEHISLELAKRVVRAEKGVAAPAQPEAEQPKTAGKINETLLKAQYENIKTTYGIDLLSEGVLNETELKAISEGEMDFNAAALRILSERTNKTETKAKNTPAPVRNGNGKSTASSYDFMSMTDEEFDRFNAKVGSGYAFKPR